jgi:hypothetical protein
VKAPKIIQVFLSRTTPDTEKAREDLEREAIAAFENVTDALAAQFPGMTSAERGRIARILINSTANQVREWGDDVITVYLPDTLRRDTCDGGAEFVRAYDEAREQQPHLARAMTKVATARQARGDQCT